MTTTQPPQSIEELLTSEGFKKKVNDRFKEMENDRFFTRLKLRESKGDVTFKRDWFDRLTTSLNTADAIASEYLSICKKQSKVSSELREIITWICYPIASEMSQQMDLQTNTQPQNHEE